MRSHSCIFVSRVAMILGFLVHCSVTESVCVAYSPGDIIIGILSSVHFNIKDVQAWVLPELSTCINFDLITFVQALASIHTIETINNSGFLPGIQLGYLMCDPCAYATKALHCVEHMLAINGSLTVLSDYSGFRPHVKVFLGERYTETSLPVARLLSLYRIPQIACTSTVAALSDKVRYTSFFRVIPSNKHQTMALAKLLSHFEWYWVGVVYLDDEYGKDVFENFLTHADKEKICLAFQEVVPNYLDMKQDIKKVADRIQSSNATVVLLILRVQQVEMLLKEMIKTNTTRTWIASNTWSLARYLMKMEGINNVGDILGINFITGEIPGFEDYLQNLKPGPGAWNDLIKEYKQMRFNCSSGQQSEHASPSACNVTDPQEANDDYLLQAVDPTEAYNQRVAVYAVAHGLKKLLKCNDTACSGDTDFLPWKLINILRGGNFTLDNQTYSFNEKGDFETGYDIMMWKKNGDKISKVVGKFLIKTGEIEIKDEEIEWSNKTMAVSRCSHPCPPGTEKNILSISCCYECINCNEGYYSNKWDQPACQQCPNGSWSLSGSSQCYEWKISFLEWSSPYSIVVVIGTVIGIGLLVFSFAFFIHHRDKSIIKDFLIISCLMKLGLLVSFGSVILFLGKPNIHLCMAQQTMYALGFTLCVSCILVKAFNTCITFMSSDPGRRRRLSKLDQPFVFICFLTLGQALICIFWLIFDPLNVDKDTISKSQALTKNLLCTQGSMYGFGAMHVYIALLAVVCFIMAIKGRDNETEPIVFSMLIHLLAWLCFIPVYITQYELRPIVQISAIMVSNYGVIFCHFTPKWYTILVEKAEIPKTLKSPGSLPTDDQDSGVGNVAGNSLDSISMRSFPQAQFCFGESEISDNPISEISNRSSLYSAAQSDMDSNVRHRVLSRQRARSF